MSKDVLYCKNMKMQNLNYIIESVRTVLNEICADVDLADNYKETLIISRCLDELIVEYMKQSIKDSKNKQFKVN